MQEVKLLQYRERLGLSYREALEEPNEAIEHALVIWSQQAKRDKLEAERQKH